MKSNKKNPSKILKLLVSVLLLASAVVLGYGLGTNKPRGDSRYTLASRGEISLAEQQIRDKFKQTVAANCDSDIMTPQERLDTFEKYLKVNKYANRAVIRGCDNIDEFLVKGLDGSWQGSTVNVSLDLRANPFWRAECLADDILEVDDTVRPENSSIDASNLAACQAYTARDFAKSQLEATDEKVSDNSVYQLIQHELSDTGKGILAPTDETSHGPEEH